MSKFLIILNLNTRVATMKIRKVFTEMGMYSHVINKNLERQLKLFNT